MSRGKSHSDRLVDAALKLTAKEDWARLNLVRIARAARLPLADAHAACPTKAAVLGALSRRLDQAVLAEDDPSMQDEAVRDRLFDVAMRRFDAMLPQRAAIAKIYRDLRRDPLALAATVPQMRRSLIAMVEAAGLDSTGWRGGLRVRAFGLAFARSFMVWLDEGDEGQAKTMAELDRRLRQVEWILIGGSRHSEPGSV